MNSEKAQAMLPQSESGSADDEGVQRGYSSALSSNNDKDASRSQS